MTQTSTPTRSGSVTPTLDPSDPLDPTEFDTELYTEDTEEPDLSELSLADDPDPPSIAGGETDEAEDLELERFRNEWQDELHNRRKDGQGGVGGAGPSKRWAELERKNQMEQNIPRESGSVRPAVAIDVIPEPIASGSSMADSPKAAIRHMPLDEDEDEGDEEMGSGLAVVPIQRKQAANQPIVGDRKEQAVALYARAVEHEQSGKLNEALMMYRKAFRLDDNVDRSYAKSANIAAAQAAAASPDLADIPSSADIVSSAAPIEEPYSFQRHLQLQPDYEKSIPLHPTQVSTRHASASTSTRLSPLTTILSRLPIPADQIEFIPSDENLPLPLSKLPIELLDPILGYLDVASIERFALTCWRARYVSSRAPKWKRIVEGLYKSPGILSVGKSVKDLDVMAKYSGEWRTALMEEERVRMDGCYISVCHYIRPGAGDQWVTITHMITYHRFLRFYPDGTVISFLTTDHPSEVVPLLRPSIRGKGLHFGRWRLIRSDSPENDPPPPPPPSADGPPVAAPAPVEIDGPRKPKKEEKKRARIVITDLMEPGTESPKYEFEMELALRETGRGRWNKLDILNYQSINLANGESLGLSLKHQKPFYFSKVKSYHPQL